MSLNNAQYNGIMRVYGDRRMRSERILRERTDEVYAAVPAYRELDKEAGTLFLEAAEALMRGDREPKQALSGKIRELGLKKQKLLKNAGYPEGYLIPQYVCQDCKDTGFLDGKKCHCFLKMQRKLLYQQSNVEDIVLKQNFDNFDLLVFDNREILSQTGGRTNRAYMADVKALLMDWCSKKETERSSVILTGAPGTGKTFLMNCVTKRLLDKGQSVVYLGSTDLFEGFSREMREGEYNFHEGIIDVDLLLIDDLGTEFSNSFTTSKLFYVINQRLVMRKPVMISTNLNFRALRDRYSDRVVSRIMSDYEIIPLYGRDQRV